MGILFLIIGILGMAFFKDTVGSMLWNVVGYVWVKLDSMIDAVTGK